MPNLSMKNRVIAAAVIAVLGATGEMTWAQLGQLTQAQAYLINNGLMLSSMATSGDVFNQSTYSGAGYTMDNWENTPNFDQMGSATWSQWVSSPGGAYDKAAYMAVLPGGANEPVAAPVLNNLVSLEMGDELNLNDPAVFATEVQWFQDAKKQLPNVLLYANHYGGQVSDTTLGNFIAQAHPDLICFDEYPFQSVYNPNGSGNPDDTSSYTPIGGPPNAWMSQLWRYRQFGIGYNVPVATYMQVFHSVEDYDSTVYRDPSESELHMNASVALAFNVKALIGFQYNASSSTTLFTKPGGDSHPTALYAAEQDVNKRATNLGKALVQLKPIADMHNPNDVNPPAGPVSTDNNFPDGTTTSMMIIAGKNSTGTFNSQPAYAGFTSDPQQTGSSQYSWWEYQKNDPYLNGWGVTNLGNPTTGVKMNGGNAGNAIISWFTPLVESLDGSAHSNEVYMMVVNELTDPMGSAADCTQRINLNFQNIPDGDPNTPGNQGIELLDPETGLLSTPTLTSVGSGKYQLSLVLAGGDAVLFKFNDGAPFVGIDNAAFVPEPGMMSLAAAAMGLMVRRKSTRK
jgi:hypothetical protein